MIFILSKVLIFVIKPAFWVFVFLIIALTSRRVKTKKRFLVISITALFIFSNSFLIGKAFNAYETGYPAKGKKYDIAIVLGGFSGLNKRKNEIEFGSSSDRLFQAIALYKKGIVNKILISSGNANLIDKQFKEADLAINYLKLIGIPNAAIMVENQSRNTIENARFSFELIKKQKPDAKVLVITSAYHIPRAKLIFNKVFGNGLDYYPTNYVGNTEYDLSDFIIPNPSNMETWSILFKEWVGLAVDYFRS